MTWYVRTANREFGPLSEQAAARHRGNGADRCEDTG